jgi:hypothetical protein
VKHADDLVLLATEGTVLQVMIGRLFEIGRHYGMENVEYFKYLCCLIIDDARYTCELKCSIAMAKAAFNRKKFLFISKFDLNLRKKHLEHSNVRC